MPVTNAAKELYRSAIQEGHGEEDFSAIYDYLAHNSAVKTLRADGEFQQSDTTSRCSDSLKTDNEKYLSDEHYNGKN
jgi:hypothetical protein